VDKIKIAGMRIADIQDAQEMIKALYILQAEHKKTAKELKSIISTIQELVAEARALKEQNNIVKKIGAKIITSLDRLDGMYDRAEKELENRIRRMQKIAEGAKVRAEKAEEKVEEYQEKIQEEITKKIIATAVATALATSLGWGLILIYIFKHLG